MSKPNCFSSLLDELGIEALGAAILRVGGIELGGALHLTAGAEIAAADPEMRAVAGVGARELRDHPLDRAAGRELHHGEAIGMIPNMVGMMSRMRRRM